MESDNGTTRFKRQWRSGRETAMVESRKAREEQKETADDKSMDQTATLHLKYVSWYFHAAPTFVSKLVQNVWMCKDAEDCLGAWCWQTRQTCWQLAANEVICVCRFHFNRHTQQPHIWTNTNADAPYTHKTEHFSSCLWPSDAKGLQVYMV